MSISSDVDAERFHQRDRIGLGVRRGGEAGHRIGQDMAARPAQQVERPGADDQRVGGIEPAGDADHHALDAGRAQPLRQARDLDVVGLVAVLLEPRRDRRARTETARPCAQADIAGRRIERGTPTTPERRRDCAGGCRRSCPSACARGAAGRDRRRRARTGCRRGSARSRPASRRSRRSTPGRPRRDRWSIRRRRRRRRDRRRRSARTATRTAGGASPPCRW